MGQVPLSQLCPGSLELLPGQRGVWEGTRAPSSGNPTPSSEGPGPPGGSVGAQVPLISTHGTLGDAETMAPSLYTPAPELWVPVGLPAGTTPTSSRDDHFPETRSKPAFQREVFPNDQARWLCDRKPLSFRTTLCKRARRSSGNRGPAREALSRSRGRSLIGRQGGAGLSSPARGSQPGGASLSKAQGAGGSSVNRQPRQLATGQRVR